MSRLVGIIGGMGPMASQLFYKMVTEMTAADCDQEHLNLLIYSDASMPDRTSAILNGNYEEVYAQLLRDARVLERSGCEAIGIVCNTAHFFTDMMENEIGIPIIHMIKETTEKIAENTKGKSVAVLATDGTIKTELYQRHLEQAGIIPFIVSEDMQKLVMYQIYERIKNGKPCHQEKWKKLDDYLRASGCKNVILACTELSVINEQLGLDDFYIDPMRVLAGKIMEFGHVKFR